MLVVDDPAKLDKKQLWIAALTGLLVCSAQCIRESTVGPFLKYQSATSLRKRNLHLTLEFKNKHKMVTQVLQDACQLDGGKWKMSDTSTGKNTLRLGGQRGRSAKQFLKDITHIVRAKSRLR